MGARTASRGLIVLLSVAMALTMMMGVALAQEDDYPPPEPPEEVEATIEIQKDAIAPGDIQRIFGAGWEEGSEVEVTITWPDGRVDVFTATADAAGEFTLEFRVPADMPDGEVHVSAEGVDRGTGQTVVITDTFTVDSALPITGTGFSRMLLSAGLLLVVGAGLVIVARKRRLAEAAAIS